MADLTIAQRIADQVLSQLDSYTSGSPNELWDMRGNSAADGAQTVYLEDESTQDNEETTGSASIQEVERVLLIGRLIAHPDDETPDPGATTKLVNQAIGDIHDAIMRNRQMVEDSSSKCLAIDTHYTGARSVEFTNEQGEAAEVHAVAAFRVTYQHRVDSASTLRDGTSKAN